MVRIKAMMERMERRLSIDLGDLRRFDQNLTARSVPWSVFRLLMGFSTPYYVLCICSCRTVVVLDHGTRWQTWRCS